MNTENKVTISQRIFTLVRGVPGLTTEDIHEKLSVDTKYKTSSGKQTIYRLVRAKYIRKNKDGKLFTKIGEYRPLPPVVKKKKRVVKADPAMNAYNQYPFQSSYKQYPIAELPKIPVVTDKPGFFAKLRSFFK
jgi:hypothetical protein